MNRSMSLLIVLGLTIKTMCHIIKFYVVCYSEGWMNIMVDRWLGTSSAKCVSLENFKSGNKKFSKNKSVKKFFYFILFINYEICEFFQYQILRAQVSITMKKLAEHFEWMSHFSRICKSFVPYYHIEIGNLINDSPFCQFLTFLFPVFTSYQSIST